MIVYGKCVNMMSYKPLVRIYNLGAAGHRGELVLDFEVKSQGYSRTTSGPISTLGGIVSTPSLECVDIPTKLLTVTRCQVQVGCVAQLAERQSLAGELTMSCARPSEDG